MNSHARLWQDDETRFIESRRPRYEGAGFTFTVRPDAAHLPAFMDSHRPDAIAQKPGKNLAIAVMQGRNPSGEQALRNMRRLFERQPDWQFQIIFRGKDVLDSISIPASSLEEIRMRMNEVRAPTDRGHCRLETGNDPRR